MKISTLSSAVDKAGSQEAIAKRLKTTQGAIANAIRNNRHIYIIESKKDIAAFEVKGAFFTEPDLSTIIKMIKV